MSTQTSIRIDHQRKLALLRTVVILFATGFAQAQEGFFDNVMKLENPMINTGGVDMEPRISPDGLELYFSSARTFETTQIDLYVASRRTLDQPFTEVRALDELNTTDWDARAQIWGDNRTLYFDTCQRPGGHGETDLWLARRENAGERFGEPENLGPGVNTDFDDAAPFVSNDGLALYFASNRRNGGNDWDLYVARRTSVDDSFQSPQSLEEFNTNGFESTPSLSSDGLTLFFSQNPGTSADIWMASRESPTDEFENPLNIGSPVNTGSNFEFAASVSSNWPAPGATLYFTRCPTDARCDIYQATWHHDCNGNQIDDLEDLATGTLKDDNQNGIPDECEPRLDIESAVIVSWPIDAPGYILEGAETPEGPWEAVNAPLEIREGSSAVIVKIEDKMAFYRLHNMPN